MAKLLFYRKGATILKFGILLLTTFLLLVSQGPLAHPSIPQSCIEHDSSIIDRINAIYFGTYRIQEAFQASSYDFGSKSTPVLNNQFFLNYRLSKTQFVGLVLGFEISPFTYERSYFYNPAFRVGDYNLISTDSLTLSSDLRILFPLNSESRTQKMITGLASQNRIRWRPFPGRFSFDSLLFTRVLFFSQNASGRTFFLFDRAGLNYDFSSSIGMSLSTVIQVFKENRTAPQSFQFDPVRLGPGLYGKVDRIDWEVYLTFDVSDPKLSDGALLGFLRAKIF